MSLVFQGTSYTITNAEHVTGLTTATNYAREIVPSVPVHKNWTDGPFVHADHLTMPEKYILCKTHCTFCSETEQGPGITVWPDLTHGWTVFSIPHARQVVATAWTVLRKPMSMKTPMPLNTTA